MKEAGRRFKAQERERQVKLISKKAWEKRKDVQKKKLIHYRKVIYINTAFDDILSKSTYILLCFYVSNNVELQSTSSQIVEQCEVI